MEGRLLHINQGELYVYSPDGGLEGLDTIKIQGGRFAYEVPCKESATLVLIFPNYSTQPVFAESGEAVEIKADASHLKEMEVEGTDDNELMTKFRKQIASVPPPDEKKYAAQFIADHPQSAVSGYLVSKYFVQTEAPDYKKAMQMIDKLLARQPRNAMLARQKRLLLGMENTNVGDPLPKFSAHTLDGKTITNADLKGKIVIINLWATWNYESIDLQRALDEAVKKDYATVLGISADADRKEAQQTLKNNGVEFPNVCDGMMMDSKLVKTLGLTTIPDNIIIKNGRIAERHITASTIRQRLDNFN